MNTLCAAVHCLDKDSVDPIWSLIQNKNAQVKYARRKACEDYCFIWIKKIKTNTISRCAGEDCFFNLCCGFGFKTIWEPLWRDLDKGTISTLYQYLNDHNSAAKSMAVRIGGGDSPWDLGGGLVKHGL